VLLADDAPLRGPADLVGELAVDVARSELFRVLADPSRMRLLALAQVEELAVGELADLLGDALPKISRHAAALRDAGLLVARRQGTWTLLRTPPEALRDPVVADAVRAGLAACERSGLLARVESVVAARDARTREFFARTTPKAVAQTPGDLPAHLAAIAPVLADRRLAVDVGTGDGAGLEVLAPLFGCVVAVDRSEERIAHARDRVAARGYSRVQLIAAEIDASEVREAVDGVSRDRASRGADLVFAGRVLHHAAAPQKTMRALASLARPGGAVVVLDYDAHEDTRMREEQADVWLGFSPNDLVALATEAGLERAAVERLAPGLRGDGPDRHLTWHVLRAHKAASTS
jgi:DNA-binding transcriptional ArsR family regulator/SAM-dependent methyltransferase